jgi:hypothetical protein
LPVALIALIFPTIWYILAYLKGGREFLDLVWAENFGRFFGIQNLNIDYSLGHTESWWYYPATLAGGFFPWTLLLFISLFGLKFTKKIPSIKAAWNAFRNQEKIKLFSATAAIVIILFYCVPMSKRSVYLMPAYPFIAIFIAQYVLYLTEYRKIISRIFNIFIGLVASVISIITLFTVVIPILDPVQLASAFTKHEKTLNDIDATLRSFHSSVIIYGLLLCLLMYAIYVLIKYLWKKNSLKMLYATIGVYLAVLLVIDGVYLPAYKDGISIKPYAKSLKINHSIKKDNLYVMNNPREYSNMYGLNFYLHNHLLNFEKVQPEEGYLIVGKGSFKKVYEKYNEMYDFILKEDYNNKCRDGEKIIQLYLFRSKNVKKAITTP